MSIYSGFATRTQQNYYDQVLYNLISTLLVRISKFYQGEKVNEESFLRIITNQEKCLRKLEKRKYLEPKYAELLEHFLRSSLDEESHRTQEQYKMNRTLSVLDKQFQELKNQNQKHVLDKGDAHSLTKIQERVKKSKKKSKQKKNSVKSNLDVWQFKAEKKPPELPSLQPLEHRLTRTNFNTQTNFSEIRSKEISDYGEDSIGRGGQTKALIKPPKFRAKMFFKQYEK